MSGAKDQMKRDRFAEEFVIDLNGKQAAIRAGYAPGSAEVTGSRLLSDAKVRAKIDELMRKRAEKSEITAERVLQEIDRIAFFDVGEIVTHTLTCPADLALLPEDVRRAVTGWKYDTRGNFIVTFADKKGALELRGRHMKLFTDRSEITNPPGESFRTQQIPMTDDELRAEAEKRGLPPTIFQK